MLLKAFFGTAFALIMGAGANAQILERAPQQLETILYDSRRDACDGSDLPDAPTRAVRNSDGQLVLFAPNFKARAFEGPSLSALSKDCRIRFSAAGNPDPNQLDDRTWIHSMMSLPDGRIFALASASYMPYRHNQSCADGKNRTACWYNGIAALISNDGGKSFSYLGNPPQHLVLRPPEPYSSSYRNPPGFITATNIVKHDGYAYTIVWYRGQKPTERYNCLLRAPISNPLEWEAWTGSSYESVARFDDNRWVTSNRTCAAIGEDVLENVRSIIFHEPSKTFIAVYSRSSKPPHGTSGFYYSTSGNLRDWSDGKLIYQGRSPTREQLDDPTDLEVSITYPAFLDENSTDPDFGTGSDQFDLIFVRLAKTASGGRISSYRQLVRVPLIYRSDSEVERTGSSMIERSRHAISP
ncbi:hypothetical protein [Microvirga sp. P5_D2]